MKAHFEKSADSRRANCPETKSWSLGHAIWLVVLCLALWAGGLRAVAQTPAKLDPQLYAGLTITGAAGTVYSIEYVTDLAETNSWRCLEFLQLAASPYLWADKSAPATGRRFYRAVVFAAPSNLVFIPPGTFRMGDPTNGGDFDLAQPQTAVTISRGFWMGKYEVTQGEYLAVMGSNPSSFTGDLNRPVERVSWFDATNYCGQLTQRDRVGGRIATHSAYRLPTEAEWEYACRGWTSTPFSYGDDPGPFRTNLTNYAWYNGNHGGTMPHPLGQKLPSPWGLYDMHGNAVEWCQDWWSFNLPGGIAIDPQGPATGSLRVVRSGDACLFCVSGGYCRSAYRNSAPPDQSFFGFRVVLAPGQP